MSEPPDNIVKLGIDTLSLCEYKSGSNKGFWLYDKTRGMNLAMRAETETAAFVEALKYYQDRLQTVEAAYLALRTQVDAFITTFDPEKEN